jgi:uncharacterized membrane protein
MSLDSLWKLIHILAAFWMVGGLLGRTFALGAARRAPQVPTVQALVQLAGRFENLMVRPGSLLILGVGVLAAWAGGWPVLGFLQGGSSNWVLVSLVLYLTSIPVIIAVFIPRGRIFEAALQEAVTQGSVTPRLTTAFDDRAVAAGHIYEWIIVVVIIGLMVLKPF